MNKEVNCGSQIGNGFVTVVSLLSSSSVYNYSEDVLTEIETRMVSLARKHSIG